MAELRSTEKIALALMAGISAAIAAAVVFIFVFVVTNYDRYDFDLNDYDYDDKWIVGNTLENVRERYGEFDTEWITPYQRFGYYLGTGRPADMDGVFRFYYYMDYNSDGVITKVYVSYDPRGG